MASQPFKKVAVVVLELLAVIILRVPGVANKRHVVVCVEEDKGPLFVK